MTILLISYVFPPYYGIGGRRWAKHTLELARRGHTVHVISAKNPYSKSSLWTDELRHQPNITVHQLSSLFPKVLVDYTPTILNKLVYKFWITLLPFLTKGTIYDRAVFWNRWMLKKASSLIEKNDIKHAIISGAPFSSMYYGTLLKKKHNNLFVLNDMRDPWTWGLNWGYEKLDAKRMGYEKQLEKQMIENSNIITVPVEVMKTHLANCYPDYKDKIKVLPHFFDSSEIITKSKTPTQKIRLVLYGTIYQYIEHMLEQSALFFSNHKHMFELDIYTDNHSSKSYFEKRDATNVRFLNTIPAKELFSKFDNYDYVLLYTPSYGKDNISTKFFEIISTKTPIILFSEKGIASDFIENNRLGIHVTVSDFETKMMQIYNREVNIIYNNEYDLSPYSLTSIGDKLINYLQKNN